jgi:hypothetical protein
MQSSVDREAPLHTHAGLLHTLEKRGKTVRVYRVVVDSYPEGSDKPGWQPTTWVPYVLRGIEGDDYSTEFSWPRRKNYFSEKAAYQRLYIFQQYGATGHVETSDPITWQETS